MHDPPDVCFVVLDSLRKDHVSAYGSDRETTPALDAFAERATTYDNAYAPAPWTLPSHCSMFTGRFPSEHGVTNGFTDRNLSLPEEHETVAEALSERGYRTAGFSNNPWVGQLSGLDRGFDRFVEWDLEISRSDGAHRRRDELFSRSHSLLGRATQQPLVLLKRRFFTSNLVTRATRWLGEADGPTFTFLNLMEAHSPYYPPDSAFEALGLPTPGPLAARSLNTKLLAYTMGKRDLRPAEQDRIHEFLAASVRYQDRQFERLLTALREQGRLEDALVIVCADHGKTLGEFDRDATPPHYVRDINVNVPLFVKRPGQTSGERRIEPVELADLAALVRNPASGTLATTDGALAEDFVPHTGTESQSVTRWRALSDGDEKYVRGDDGQEYVLSGDGRAETVAPASAASEDALERYRERFAARIGRLDAGGGSDRAAAAADLDGGLESQLQDLGYLD